LIADEKIVNIIGRPTIARKIDRTLVRIVHPGLSFTSFVIYHENMDFERSLEKSLSVGGRLMTDVEARYMLRILPEGLVKPFNAARVDFLEFWVFSPTLDRLPSVQKLGYTCDVANKKIDSCLRRCTFPVLVVFD
jgi:hypothetical protein